MADKIKLTDILSAEDLQRMQDAFAEVAQITTLIVDPECEPITEISNLHGFCKKMREDEAGSKKCLMANAKMCALNRETKEPVIMACPFSGLATAAVPIYFGEEYLGSWLIGQARTSDPGPGVLADTARELDMDEDELDELIQILPKMEEDAFGRIFDYLKELGKIITSLARARYETGKSGAMLRKFIDSADMGMYVADYHTGEMLMVNRYYAELLGMSEEEVLGKKCWDVGGPGGGTFCPYCPREKLLDENGSPAAPYEWENYNDNPDFSRWLRCTNQAITWVDGRLAHLVVFLDITEERKMREQLARLAYYDRFSGLPNINKLVQDVAAEEGGAGCLVCYDITKLRRVNDAYGRDAGDALLKAVVQWMRGENFGSLGVYRIEGDEFCLYFADGDDLKAMAAAQAILDRFTELWALEVRGQSLQVSCGAKVAVVPLQPGDDEDELLSRIERTMGTAQEKGSVVVYSQQIDDAIEAHGKLELTLKQCVKDGMQGFDLNFQPLVDPTSGTWKGLEALCRWVVPATGERVPPLVFIGEAEQLGLIVELGMWVLREAVTRCKTLALDEVDGFFLSVNLSPKQVADPQFVSKVTGLLKETDFPGEKLVLEVTESAEFTFSDYSMEAIDQLRFRGIRFSLDDFGTGYSSFNNLKNLPVSMLKTEREFISGIDEDSYMQYFFYTMAQLAHAADMKLIAEGVETREQLDIILKNGVDYLQGYFFSKPLTTEQLSQNLERFSKVDPAFYEQRGGQISENIFSGSQGWLNSPKLFKLLNESMQLLLAAADIDEAFGSVLELVGRHFGISRSYIHLKQREGRYTNTHEWVSPGVAPRKEQLADIAVDEVDADWVRTLHENGMVVAANAVYLPAGVRKTLEARGMCAVAVLPLHDANEVVGLIGLEHRKYREWLPEEIQLLRNLAMVMGSMLKKAGLKQEVERGDARFGKVLDHIGLGIMLSEPESSQILWANEALCAMWGVPFPVAGQSCHQTLRGKKQRCEFCKVDMLLKNPGMNEYVWEQYDAKTGRWYMVNDSLVQWDDARKMHLQYMVDITESKQAQKVLEDSANTDLMTGTLSRGGLLGRLREKLAQANLQQRPLSLVFVDIDRLKYANDIHGHGFGDELIQNTVRALRAHVREADQIGRYGGDEFIVLMEGCDAQQAENRMESARSRLQNEDYAGAAEFTFSYGVVQSDELPYEKDDRVLNALINLADDRMRDYKKQHRQAQRGSAPGNTAVLELLGIAPNVAYDVDEAE